MLNLHDSLNRMILLAAICLAVVGAAKWVSSLDTQAAIAGQAQAEIDQQARVEFGLLHLGTLEVMRQQEARKVQEAIWHQASRGGDGIQRRYKLVTLEVTAYSTGKLMYNGLPVDKGALAVDKSIIPLNSVVWLPGIGYTVAMDQGRDIKGLRADLYLPSREDALRWGVQKVRVKVLE